MYYSKLKIPEKPFFNFSWAPFICLLWLKLSFPNKSSVVDRLQISAVYRKAKEYLHFVSKIKYEKMPSVVVHILYIFFVCKIFSRKIGKNSWFKILFLVFTQEMFFWIKNDDMSMSATCSFYCYVPYSLTKVPKTWSLVFNSNLVFPLKYPMGHPQRPILVADKCEHFFLGRFTRFFWWTRNENN